MFSKRRPDWKTRDKRKPKDKVISVARKRTYTYKQVYIINFIDLNYGIYNLTFKGQSPELAVTKRVSNKGQWNNKKVIIILDF